MSAVAVAALLVLGGALTLNRSDGFAFFIAVFFGPLVGLAGAFFDARRGQPLGLLLLVLGVFVTFDGALNLGLLGLPAVVLVLVALIAGIIARRRASR